MSKHNLTGAVILLVVGVIIGWFLHKPVNTTYHKEDITKLESTVDSLHSTVIEQNKIIAVQDSIAKNDAVKVEKLIVEITQIKVAQKVERIRISNLPPDEKVTWMYNYYNLQPSSPKKELSVELIDSTANTLVENKFQKEELIKKDSVIETQAHKDSVQREEIVGLNINQVRLEQISVGQKKIILTQKEDLKTAGNQIKKAGLRGLGIGAAIGVIITILIIGGR